MSAANVYPDATITAYGTLTGGASLHAVLADASSASYTTVVGTGAWGKVSAGLPTKPAGSVTKSIQLAMSVSSISVNTTRIQGQIEYDGKVWSAIDVATIAGTSPQTIVGPTVQPGDLTAAQLGDMVLAVRRAPSGAVTNGRIYDAWVYEVFAEQPVTTISSPTTGGTIAAASQVVVWDHAPGAEGGPQVWWRGVVSDGFTGTVVQDTGVVASSATSYEFTGLAPGRTYAFTIYTAQQVYAGQGHWSGGDFTYVTVAPATTAEVLTVDAWGDPATGSMIVEVERDTGEDAWDGIELERNFDFDSLLVGGFETGAAGLGTGWTEFTVNSPTSTSKSLETAGGWDGQFQRLSATVDFGDFYWIGAAIDVTPGALLRLEATVKGTAAADCAVTLTAAFSTDPNATVSQIYSAPSETVTQSAEYDADWQTVEVAPTIIPTDARRMAVLVGIVGLTGASAGACVLDIDNVIVTQGGFGWQPVRGASDETPGADDHVFADFEAPPDRDIRYRARAVKDAGPVVGQWVHSVAASWSVDEGVWFKVATNPELNYQFKLAKPPSITRPQRRGVFRPAGARLAVTVADLRSARETEFVVMTPTEAAADALEAILDNTNVVLVHAASIYRFDPGYWSLGDLDEAHLSRWVGAPYRHQRLPAVETDAPA